MAENFVKNQGDINNDIMKVKTLMYAHLLREEVSDTRRHSLAPSLPILLHYFSSIPESAQFSFFSVNLKY